jgi:eukaryotic-like serine/threonine-protein kinase
MRQRLEPGVEIDGFTLVEPLKKGGMAVLWRVTHPAHAGALVMKIPLILEGDDPTMIVGFEMEQMILPRLSGRHVPTAIANGDFAAQPHLVMEWIDGRSLLERMDGTRHTPEETIAIGRAIAGALADLHRQRVVHLDVKPANILFRTDGTAVLVDFGLARHLDLPDLLAEEFRIPMGTAPYIAPEQVLGARDDPRSDIFALGAVLYELITGKKPFGDPKPSTANLKKRFWADPVPPRALQPACPEWLQEIVLQCLEVEPSRRPPSARHLLFALRNPESIAIGERGRRARRAGLRTRFRRWLSAQSAERPAPNPAAARVSDVPIVVAAVDLSEDYSEIAAAVRATAARALAAHREARLACVNVLKTKRIGMDELVDAEGQSLHVRRLVELKAWAEPLKLGLDRATFHVLEHPDPAEALVTYAEENGADEIVMGARGASSARRFLGSVSAEVAARAPCTVTVVRVRGAREAKPEEPRAAA